jgi:hypothetical protein
MIAAVLAGIALAGVMGLVGFLFLRVLPRLEQLAQTIDKQRGQIAKLQTDITAKPDKTAVQESIASMKRALAERAAKLAELEEDTRLRREETNRPQPQIPVQPPVEIEPPKPKSLTSADVVRIWSFLVENPPLNAKRFVSEAVAAGYVAGEVHGAVPLSAGRPLGFLIEGNTGVVWFLPNNAATLGDLQHDAFDIPQGAYIANAVRSLEVPAEWRNGSITTRGRVS